MAASPRASTMDLDVLQLPLKSVQIPKPHPFGMIFFPFALALSLRIGVAKSCLGALFLLRLSKE